MAWVEACKDFVEKGGGRLQGLSSATFLGGVFQIAQKRLVQRGGVKIDGVILEGGRERLE